MADAELTDRQTLPRGAILHALYGNASFAQKGHPIFFE
jgi:hypothetical protein